MKRIYMQTVEAAAAPTQCVHHKLSCEQCGLSALCLPLVLQHEEIERLDTFVNKRELLSKGSVLYRQGDEFRHLYALRSGAMKTWRLSDSGTEQVTGFYLAGEIMGMDGIAEDRHNNFAQALEPTAVCEIPFADLENLSLTVPALQRHFLKLMSREIAVEQQLVGLLATSNAEQRVVAFLLNLLSRQERRGLSGTDIMLAMPRSDIANFLGLTVETVSRLFSRLAEEQLIAVSGRRVSILDRDSLQRRLDG